jgi:hypothetical protein
MTASFDFCKKNDIGANMFSPLFNTVKPQIGWKWVNKERKIRMRANKEFKIFEGLIRNSDFLGANKEFVLIAKSGMVPLHHNYQVQAVSTLEFDLQGPVSA